MKKCTANMTAICRRLKRMRELKKLPLEEQRKKLKRVRPIKPYHKAKKGTAKKYAGILKMALSEEGNPAVQYKGKYYDLPIKPQGGIYEGFTPIKKKGLFLKQDKPMTQAERNEKWLKHMMKRPVDLHLTRKDAKYLQLILDGFTAPPSESNRRLRILNKLKRAGIK